MEEMETRKRDWEDKEAIGDMHDVNRCIIDNILLY